MSEAQGEVAMDDLPDQHLVRVQDQFRLPLPDRLQPQFRLLRLQPLLLVRAAVRT